MGVRLIEAAEAAGQLAAFDAVLDARSPTEFADDHLPGAVNWPVLSDEERRDVGTIYAQVSPFDARKLGASLVARNIASHLERHRDFLQRDWSPLVYCWRGGQRSGTLAWFLDQVGFRTTVLKGGYKAFRRLVLEELERLPAGLDLRIVCGRTGCGKTRLLAALQEAGAQVLDLEALAAHRGSVLGGLPDVEQPTQRHFETRLWRSLRALDPRQPVWVESESRKIGRVHLPEALITRMRQSARCFHLSLPDPARVALLLEDYAHLTHDLPRFEALLAGLVPLRGRERVERWRHLARDGRWAEAFESLMLEHYDPGYLESMQRNFASFGEAQVVTAPDGSPASLLDTARHLLQREASAAAAPTG
ncbi:MAG: tRNA 2-selenouridine(34) synthase MnmH [Ideonella sp.]|nr:tRNA 2-selenouridine(34) synthase MnmH [Ideonella sp.]